MPFWMSMALTCLRKSFLCDVEHKVASCHSERVGVLCVAALHGRSGRARILRLLAASPVSGRSDPLTFHVRAMPAAKPSGPSRRQKSNTGKDTALAAPACGARCGGRRACPARGCGSTRAPPCPGLRTTPPRPQGLAFACRGSGAGPARPAAPAQGRGRAGARRSASGSPM